jgi:hypothetical protein
MYSALGLHVQLHLLLREKIVWLWRRLVTLPRDLALDAKARTINAGNQRF